LLPDFNPEDAALQDYLRLIAVDSFRSDHHLELVMDDEEEGRTVAYLAPN
jgi:hypothetical protein